MVASVPLVPTFVRARAARGYERRNRNTSRLPRFPRPVAWAMCSARPIPFEIRDVPQTELSLAMFPKPKSALAPNTYAYESEPLVKPTGFREYDARWLLEKEINLMGV